MYVADTHALVHYSFTKRPLLGKMAKKILEDAEAGKTIVFVPTVVLWEICSLAELGRINLHQTFEHWCRSLDSQPGFSIVNLEWLDIKEARHLTLKDPFDRLIAGTALRLDATLITKDRQLVESNVVQTIW